MQNDTINEGLAYVFANMSDAVCVTRKNGAVLHVNDSAAKLFGLTSYDGLKIWDAIRFTERNDSLIQLFLTQ